MPLTPVELATSVDATVARGRAVERLFSVAGTSVGTGKQALGRARRAQPLRRSRPGSTAPVPKRRRIHQGAGLSGTPRE